MKRILALVLPAVLMVAAVSGIALATPGSGVLSAPVLARGTVPDPFKVKLRDSSSPADVVVQTITIAPDGHTGWHSHPGPVLVVIAEGRFTLYSGKDRGCEGRTYGPGEAFVDPGYGHVHIGRNEGTTNVVLYATYLDVPPGEGFRIDMPAPGNCPF